MKQRLGQISLIAVLAMIPAVGAGALPLLDEAAGVVEEVVAPVEEPVQAVVEPIQETLEPVVEPVQETLEPIVEPIQETLEPIVEPVQETLEPIVEPIQETLEPIVEPIQETLEPIVEPVEDVVDPVVETIPGTSDPTAPADTDSTVSVGVSVAIASEVTSPSAEAAPSTDGTIADPRTAVLGAQLSAADRNASVEPPADADLLGTLVLAGSERAYPTRPTLAGVDRLGALDSIMQWLTEDGLAARLLAVPFALLDLLMRALRSAGEGLVAPLSMLGTLVILRLQKLRMTPGTRPA